MIIKDNFFHISVQLLKTCLVLIAERIGNSPLIEAAERTNPHMVKLLLHLGADVNHANILGYTALNGPWTTKYGIESPTRVEAMVKQLLAAGAIVNINGGMKYEFRCISIQQTGLLPVLLFAAGQKPVFLRGQTQLFPRSTQAEYFPPDWEDLGLKNQCRKVIRKHLLTLDPHTNLFIRVPQLQMTNERAGLPEKLVSYLLHDQNLEVDWEELEMD